MFGFLKKKSKLDKLQNQYENILETSAMSSSSNHHEKVRKLADTRAILDQIEILQKSM